MIFQKQKNPSEGDRKVVEKFAWLPTPIDQTTIVWLQFYMTVYRYSTYSANVWKELKHKRKILKESNIKLPTKLIRVLVWFIYIIGLFFLVNYSITHICSAVGAILILLGILIQTSCISAEKSQI